MDAPRVELHRKELRRVEVMLGMRFLTCSCQHRLPLFREDWVKDEFVRALSRTRLKHGFALLGWVMMPEHFHLLIIPRLPESPVDAVLNMLKSTMSGRVLGRWRDSSSNVLSSIRDEHGAERFWLPGGGHDRNVRDEREHGEILEYIHQNPVERGLVESATRWKWSSALWYAGDRAGVAIDSIREWKSAEGARLVKKFGNLIEAARVIRALNTD